MKNYSVIALLLAGTNAVKYVPENAKQIHGDQPLYFTAPAGWSGKQIPGREFERPDTGLDDDSVLSKRRSFNAQGSAYVPENASTHYGKDIYYTIPKNDPKPEPKVKGKKYKKSKLEEEEDDMKEKEEDDKVAEPPKKKSESESAANFHAYQSQYVPDNAKLINGDQPLYFTAPGGWSGQQIPGREFERPDTGLDDDTVLSQRRKRSRYVPDNAKLINGDQPLYFTAPGGWSGQQIPGREFERPDTGLDDDTVLS